MEEKTMKRIIKATPVALMLALAAGIAGAQVEAEEDVGFGGVLNRRVFEERIGLSAGLEAGPGDLADSPVFTITPGLVYENSFGDLDVFGELDYTVAFDDPVGQELYLEAEVGYNLRLTDPGLLLFTLNNNNTFFLAPALEEGATHEGVIEPAVTYTHTFDFGDVYGKAAFPINYLTGVEGETLYELNGTLGWASNFGMGLELTAYNVIHPDAAFAGYGLLLSFEQSIFYGEVEIKAEKEFKGFEILPEFDLTLGAWTLIIRAECYKYEDADTWEIRPFAGVAYSF
jgi:hypothetical protein